MKLVGLVSLLVCAVVSPSPAALAQELLQNGGFEDGAASWSGCGGATVVDAEAHAGRYAARIGGPSDETCGPLPASQLVIVQPVAIPADATALTLSFWFSRLGADLDPQGNSVADLAVSLTTDPTFGVALFDVVSHNVLRGWMPFRGTLRPDDLAAFRGQTAYVRFAVQYTGDTDVGYLLDDVSLVAADVRTQAAPLPAALAGDGSRPLVVVQATSDGTTVVRLDTDGTRAQAVSTGLYHLPRIPRWSPDGSAIAVVDDDVVPHDPAVPEILRARLSRLSVVGPDGTARREVFATQGKEGTAGSPPYCQPPQCIDTPRAALDQLIKGVVWSPDGKTLAVTICARLRYHWGASDDDTCHVALVDAGNGAVVRDDLDGWFRPDWGPTGRVLFNGPAQYPSYELRGVWEGDPTVTPATQELILPAPIDLLVDGDRLPTWAPDGRQFVTARQIAGLRFDANGFAVRSDAVVLHDRDDLANPRVLLIADQGGITGAIDGFSWSPDGRYVLYTLYESTAAANVWWLDVTTGATGRVTNDGASVSVDWRRRAGGASGADVPCAVEAPGVARAACYLAAVTEGADPRRAATRAGRRLVQRVVHGAATARKAVLRLAKHSPPPARRVAKARKAIQTVAAAIARARTKGGLAADAADVLDALAGAAMGEIDAL